MFKSPHIVTAIDSVAPSITNSRGKNVRGVKSSRENSLEK
jgi:hypothetical protein